MKGLSVNQKITILFMVSIGFFIATSCDQEEQLNDPLIVSVQVSADFINSYSNETVYIMASDSEGEILDYKKLDNDRTTQLSAPEYAKDNFTLSFVLTYQNTSGAAKRHLIGKSFHGINRGSNLLLKRQLSGYGNAGFFNFNLTDFDSETNVKYTLASNGDITSFFYPTSHNTGDAPIYSKNPTRLFITKFSPSQEPIGYLFPSTNYTVSRKYEISLEGTYLPFQTEQINFSDQVTAGVITYGITQIGSTKELYQVSNNNLYSGNILRIFYPGATFPAYASHSWQQVEEVYFENFNNEKRSDFNLLKVESEIDFSGQQVNYSINGDKALVCFDFDIEETESETYNWNCFASTGADQSIVIPRLPSEITSNFVGFSNSSWEANDLVEIVQMEGISTIGDYAIATAKGTWFGDRNYRYAGLNLPSDISFSELKFAEKHTPTPYVGFFRNGF